MILKAISLLSLAVGLALAQAPELKVEEGDAKKAAIEKPAPVYPPTAKQLKVTGKVVVEAIVGTDGEVTDVKIISGNPLLTKPVAETVKKWRFTPFKSDGKAVRAAASLSFDFRQ